MKNRLRIFIALTVMLLIAAVLATVCVGAAVYDDNNIMITSKAGDKICVISGREYTKAYDGEAIAGYYYCLTGYTGPILVGLTAESVAFKTTWDSRVLEYGGTVTYNGKTYYYSSTEYFMSGNHVSSGEHELYRCNGGERLSAENAALEILRVYNVICAGQYTEHQDVKEYVEESTCSAEGKIIRRCETCGEVLEERTVEKKAHTFASSVIETEPTCTSDGSVSKACTVCGYVHTDPIPALGHRYGEWKTVKAPQCVTEGSEERVCSVCNHITSQNIPALNHEYGEFTQISGNIIIPPIVKSQTCGVCGDVNTVNDWGYVWVTVLALIALIGIVVGIINYFKAFKRV